MYYIDIRRKKMTSDRLIMFGVKKLHNGRYAIASNIEKKQGRLLYYVHSNLNHKKYDLAIKKAEVFVKSCNRDFVDMQKNQVVFAFKNIGLIS